MSGARDGTEMGRRAPTLKEADPKGLVRESYAIEGITDAECRSIFLDWALSLQPGTAPAVALRVLIGEYAGRIPGHPMDPVMRAGLEAPPVPLRRGGRRGRRATGETPRG